MAAASWCRGASWGADAEFVESSLWLWSVAVVFMVTVVCWMERMVVATMMTDGSKVGDLAISSEMVRRRAQIRGGRSLGCVPGRWSILAFRSSSSELVVIAVH